MNRSECIDISAKAYQAFIFDLDGVVTDTADLHAKAWKRMFDDYLQARADRDGTQYEPFDARDDYLAYVDGKPRYDGVTDFLKSRDIRLPRGRPDDAPDTETVCGLGNRKNDLFNELLSGGDVRVYETTVSLIRSLREVGIKTAIVSSSKNCRNILKVAGLEALFDVRVDGIDSERIGLEGKPAPDIFLEAAEELGVAPKDAVVVEDAQAGVRAGKDGGFGCVLGVNRTHQAEALRT